MYGIRWLAAVVVASAACVAAPETQAQTWLRWGKAPATNDPAKQVAPPRRQTLPSVVSAEPEPVTAAIIEPQAERKETALPAATPTRRGPSVTIIEEAPQPASIAAGVAPASDPLPPRVVSTPAPSSPPVPVFDPAPPAATATPAQIDDAAIQSAPLPAAADVAAAPLAACGDCPTRDELQAISAAPGPGDTVPEDRQIQSEIKRRLLQGH